VYSMIVRFKVKRWMVIGKSGLQDTDELPLSEKKT
jgi:hypothetical protein